MSSADGPEAATLGETTLPANIRFLQIAVQEKQHRTRRTDGKTLAVQSTALSAPVFIFTASLVLSELHSGQNTDGAGRRIRRR